MELLTATPPQSGCALIKVMSARSPGEQRQAGLLDCEPLEGVDKFKYLGANGQGTEEIRSRITLGDFAFPRLQSRLWSRREISLRKKGRV